MAAVSRIRSMDFECPNCGHKITRDEDLAESAALGAWVCPSCGYEPDMTGPLVPDIGSH